VDLEKAPIPSRCDGRSSQATSKGETLEEARSNLQEAVELVLEANRLLAEESLAGREVICEKLFIDSE